jgi:hypothetical protein
MGSLDRTQPEPASAASWKRNVSRKQRTDGCGALRPVSLDAGDFRIGRLTLSTVIQALERMEHKCVQQESGVIWVFAYDEITFYPLLRDPKHPDLVPPETIGYCLEAIGEKVMDFGIVVREIVQRDAFRR